MFEITPISCTQVDWNRFVTVVNTTLQRSPTRQLDTAGLPVGVPSSYIPALGELNKKGTTPNQAFRDSEYFLKHISFGFFVSADRETLHQLLLAGQDFAIIMAEPGRNKENFVITGSLYTWKRAIVETCHNGSEPESREFMNWIWVFFDRMGFKEVFAQYRRKDAKDGTFILESRGK